MLNGAPASITPNEFLAGFNADNKNEWVTVVMLSHVYALKVSGENQRVLVFWCWSCLLLLLLMLVVLV